MKISEKFQSNFLKAEDLQGRKVHVDHCLDRR